MRRPPSGTLRSPAAVLGAALLLLCPPLAAPSAAQQGGPAPDSAALLIEQGLRARGEERAASVRRAIALWERASAVAGRRGDPSARAEALHRKGEALGALSVLDSASAALDTALSLRRSLGDHAGQGRTLVELARVELAAGRTRAARARAEEALALGTPGEARDDVEAGARAVLGVVLRLGGEPDSAFSQLRRALELRRRGGDARGEGEVLRLLGDVHRFAASPDSSEECYRRALALQEGAGDLRGAAWTHRMTGLHYALLTRRDLELAHALRARELFREVGDRRGEAFAIMDAGRYQRQNGVADSAAAAAREGLARLREVGDRWGEAAALVEVAGNLGLAGNADSAAVYLGWAVDGFRESGDLWMEGWVLVQIGDEHINANRPDSALVFYRQALALRRPARARLLEATMLQAVGVAHERLGHPDSARAAFGGALRIAREIGEPWTEMFVLEDLANLERAAGGREGRRAAVALYDTAAAVLSGVLAGIGGDRDRLGFVGGSTGPWASWTLSWLAREEEVGARRARLAALAAGERGRAQALLELMRLSAPGRQPAARGAGRLPRPGADLAAEGRRLAGGARAGGNALLVYQVAGDTLLRWLVPPSGEPRLFRVAMPRDSLAALVGGARRMLGADEASAGRGLRAVALEAPLPAAAPYHDALARLARLLLPDSLDALLPPGREVVVIPAGVLNLVPFAALPLPDGEYLGARHPLRYAPSLAAMGEAEARPALGRGTFRSALVVGDPVMPVVTTYTGEEVELDPLPGAAREAAAVAERLGVRPLGGAAAGEKAVLALLPAAPLVHLATHGFSYAAEDRAHNSFLALAPGDGEDGLLTVAEVLSQPGAMRAELVVLSACQSGLGNLQDGEGTVGLQRAFLARGARSVMVSLWSVSDRATEALMQGFYRHWLEDPDRPAKAEALRRAQADVRATPGMESPLFWASFQLAGAR